MNMPIYCRRKFLYSLLIKEITVYKMTFYYPDRKFSERQCLIQISNENYNHKKVQLFLNTTIGLVVCLLIRSVSHTPDLFALLLSSSCPG